MKKIPYELFGFPGSGKSFVYKNLYKNYDYITSYENIFFDNFFKKNFISYLYYMYIKFIFKNLSSNYLKGKMLTPYKNYLHEYLFKDLNNEIIKQYKKIKKKNSKLFKSYKELVKETNHSINFKKKILKNFKFFCSTYHYYYYYNLNDERIILIDEGFLQKIFLNYKKKRDKILMIKIINYLKVIPKDLKVLNVNTSIMKSIKQCRNRDKYFSYGQNKIFLSLIFPKISKHALLFCKKNKIKYFHLNSSSNHLQLLKIIK